MKFLYFLSFLAAVRGLAVQDQQNDLPSWIPFDASEFSHSQVLKSGDDQTVQLFWSIDHNDQSIQMGVASNNGPTWLAVGTSDAGGMLGANIWLLRNTASDNSTASFVLEERFTPIYGPPRLATTQTASLKTAYQSGNVTAFTFSRPLSGCDDQHASLTDKKPLWFIWAHGSSNTFSKHIDNARGQSLVDLSGVYFSKQGIPTQPIQIDDADVQVLDMTAPPVHLKANESTTYCYTYYDFSKLFPEKRYIVAENFTIGSKYTHHVVGYLCNDPIPQFSKPGTVYCNNYRDKSVADYIEFNNTCNARPYIVWAKGGNPRKYPNDMGNPIGPGSLNTQYMVVETHYANSDHDEEARRQGNRNVVFNVEGLELAPGGHPSSVNECGTLCTTRLGGIPPITGLTVLSTMLHMHKRGMSLDVKHVRGGKELEPLPSMKYFDFNFQSYNYVSLTQEKILPGDRIIANCTYDTSRDKSEVYGGFSSEQEMCLNFIEYYPAIGMTSCTRSLFPKVPEFNFCSIGKYDPLCFQSYLRLPYSPWVSPDQCSKSSVF